MKSKGIPSVSMFGCHLPQRGRQAVEVELLDKLEYVEKIYALYTDILYKGYYQQALTVFCYQENALRNA